MLRSRSIVVLMTILAAVVPREAAAASALTPAQIHALLSSPERHVRSDDGRITKVLAEGLRRSTTFGDLMGALNRTDVIVYIEGSAFLPSTVTGRILLSVSKHGQRYARIQIRLDRTTNELIALIGHELRHAIEIGEAPEVVDDPSMVRLYERIGHRADHRDHYDTAAARATERQVRIEL